MVTLYIISQKEAHNDAHIVMGSHCLSALLISPFCLLTKEKRLADELCQPQSVE
jgi:hypothetical protein